MTTRLSFQQLREIKTDTKLLIDELGTQAGAAEFTRVKQGQLSDYQNINAPDSYIAADVLADLLLAVPGSTRVIKVLASIAGFVLWRVPPTVASGTQLGRLSGQVLAEVGQMIEKLGAIVEDGAIAGKEPDEFDREADEAIAKILELKLQVRAEAVERDGGRLAQGLAPRDVEGGR